MVAAHGENPQTVGNRTIFALAMARILEKRLSERGPSYRPGPVSASHLPLLTGLPAAATARVACREHHILITLLSGNSSCLGARETME